MRIFRKTPLALALLGCFLLSSHSVADVIVNEVLSNEPESQVALEWIELHNRSAGTVGHYEIE